MIAGTIVAAVIAIAWLWSKLTTAREENTHLRVEISRLRAHVRRRA